MSSLFNLGGWEMLGQIIQPDLRKDGDRIVAFVHWFLVQKAKMGCLGLGTAPPLGGSFADSSEMLPDGWNELRKTYSLFYVRGTVVYQLMCGLTEDVIIVKLLNTDKSILSRVQFHVYDTEQTILECHGLRESSPRLQLVISRLVKELVNPVFGSRTSTTETQTVPDRILIRNAQQNHAIAPSQRYFPYGPINPTTAADASNVDLTIARREAANTGGLDGGGGMLFQPPNVYPPVRPDNRPSGMIGTVPGARYDTFGPPGPTNTGRLNNDHLRPPGFDEQFLD